MPFKERAKQLLFMRGYQRKRRAEQKRQKQLLEASVQAVKIMRKHLIGRACMPLSVKPHVYMMPVIRRDFELGNSEALTKAALEMVETEDKLLLVGQHKGWFACGIQGLATVPGRNVIKSGGIWPKHFVSDVRRAMKPLAGYRCYSPLKLIMNSLATNVLPEWCSVDRYVMREYSPYLCNFDGEQNNALLVAPHETHFQVSVGLDLNVIEGPNNRVMLLECLMPVIHKPKSICEITDITYA